MGINFGENGEINSFQKARAAAYLCTPHCGLFCISSISSIFPQKSLSSRGVGAILGKIGKTIRYKENEKGLPVLKWYRRPKRINEIIVLSGLHLDKNQTVDSCYGLFDIYYEN